LLLVKSPFLLAKIQFVARQLTKYKKNCGHPRDSEDLGERRDVIRRGKVLPEDLRQEMYLVQWIHQIHVGKTMP
jgi:hypothetical protein